MSLDVYLNAETGGDLVTAFEANITHNLNSMAGAAGIYECMWRPEEVGITTARDLIKPLADGLAWLRANPRLARKHNPENGWGDYEGLVEFVSEYLAACRRYPDTTVSVSR